MKVKKEIQQLRRIQNLLEDNVYPGYPFLIHGIVDMEGEGCGWIDNSRKMGLMKFCHEFDAALCFHMVGSYKATKGSWATGPHQMEAHKEFLDAEYGDFYIDDDGVCRLYFALYAAIRESRGTNNIIFFSYDGESEYACVEVFADNDEGTKLEHINRYLREYCDIDPDGTDYLRK